MLPQLSEMFEVKGDQREENIEMPPNEKKSCTGCGICLSTTFGHFAGLNIEISKNLFYKHKLIIVS